MRSLALGVAVPYLHTRLAHLETDASISAALGAALIIHFNNNPTPNAVLKSSYCFLAGYTTDDIVVLRIRGI
jgi:hypothetical protein